MRVRYAETALEEVEDILSYIAKDNPAAALRVSDTIKATVDRLSAFPHLVQSKPTLPGSGQHPPFPAAI
jgi:plasmid stabilization system protein ParE